VECEFFLIVRRKNIKRDSERTYGFPHPEEIDLYIGMAASLVLHTKIFRAMRWLGSVIGPCIGQMAKFLTLEYAARIKEAHKASCRVCAARKPEEKNLVARNEVLRDKHITGPNIVVDA
jgi:hypothetical protein